MQPDLTNVSFEEISSMPMQCYGCGKPLRHLSLIEALTSGQTLAETMNALNYQRLCCRKLIQAQPAIVALQKRLEIDRNIGQQLAALTLESTGPVGFREGGLQIVDEAPPGLVQEGLYFPGGYDTYNESGDINPFEYYVNQLEASDDETSPQ